MAVETAEETAPLAIESSTLQTKINPQSSQETDSLSSSNTFANTNSLQRFNKLIG